MASLAEISQTAFVLKLRPATKEAYMQKIFDGNQLRYRRKTALWDVAATVKKEQFMTTAWHCLSLCSSVDAKVPQYGTSRNRNWHELELQPWSSSPWCKFLLHVLKDVTLTISHGEFRESSREKFEHQQKLYQTNALGRAFPSSQVTWRRKNLHKPLFDKAAVQTFPYI